MIRSLVFVLPAVMLLGASHGQDAPSAIQTGTVTAFVNVSVLPMDTETVLPHSTVVVTGDRITAVGPSSSVTPPGDAQVIDGRGKFLMPGLAEMHGHIPGPGSDPAYVEGVLFLYVAAGVTTVRGMQGSEGQLALRERAARGEIVAPTLYLAGPAFSGRGVPTPDAAIARVKQQKTEGWDLLKVQTGLSRETYDAMARTARDAEIRFGGHVPQAVGVERALEVRQDTIDHLDGFAEHLNGQSARVPDETIKAFAARVKQSGVAVVPTMFVWETLRGPVTLESRTSLPELRYLPRQIVEQWIGSLTRRLQNPQFDAGAARQYIENRNRILRALDEAGVPILLGSDAPQQFNVPGFSIHREMASMSRAGMTPYEVLRSGTAAVGEHLREKDTFGRVATGHRADLILLDANPLADLANAARLDGVMIRGRWISQRDVQARLEAIAKASED
jgi:imidazolonepropionase-like amidohydrolase